MHPDVELLNHKAEAPVNGEKQAPRLGDLIEEIEAFILKYVRLPSPELATLVACWCAATYAYEQFDTFGYIALRSATPGCGKSRLLRVIALFANGNPPITMTPTAATIFRSTRPVQIFDEVDKLRNKDRETYGEVLAILDAGYEKDGIVPRMEKKNGTWVTREFPVYGPKALAGIERLADTLADRVFQVQMKRTPQKLARWNKRRLGEIGTRIRTDLETWTLQHCDEVREAYDKLPDELEKLSKFDDRFQDIAEPLVILASLADAERLKDSPEQPEAGSRAMIADRLMKGLMAAAGRREPSNRERELRAFLELAKARLNGVAELFVSSSTLREACQEYEDLAQIDTEKKLAGFLKHFDLFPGKGPTNSNRGYRLRREWIEDWRASYKAVGEAP